MSLARLLSRVRELYGVEDVQLWLDPGALGRAPGMGRKWIRDESEYRTIVDGDVVVFVSGGRDLDPSVFEGETTYRTDYVEKELPRRSRADAIDGPRVDLPTQYTTTYQRDYVPLARPNDNVPEYVEPIFARAPFVGQTTYATDYVEKPLSRPEIGEEYDMTQPTHRVIPTTAHRYDYKHHPSKTGRKYARPTEPPLRLPGAPWQPTEYREKYDEKKCPENMMRPYPPPPDMIQDEPPCRPTTTYNRDYVPLDHNDARSTLHVEPAAPSGHLSP